MWHSNMTADKMALLALKTGTVAFDLQEVMLRYYFLKANTVGFGSGCYLVCLVFLAL